MIDLTWTTILLLLFLIFCGLGYALHNEWRLLQIRRQAYLRSRMAEREHSARVKRIAEVTRRIAECPDPTLGVEPEL